MVPDGTPKETAVSDSIEARLRSLIATDLSFVGIPGDYATHSLHPFPARFPPQIPALFIEGLTEPGETVLDPLVGSGTVLVEAIQRGRTGIGSDLDPLAVLISSAKATPLDPDQVQSVYEEVMERAEKSAPPDVSDEKLREFREYWFLPETANDLAGLIAAIQPVADPAIRRFLQVVFSSTIVAKSAGVSLARDLAHSRPHRDRAKKVRPVRQEFERKFRKAREILESIFHSKGEAMIFRADARNLPIRSNSVDLILTSPPYSSAVDYVRAHKFTLNWLGYGLDFLTRLRRTYLGAETIGEETEPPPGASADSVERVAKVDRRRSLHMARYFKDLQRVLGECHRVLRPGRAIVWVVGSSRVRGVDVDTPRVVTELACSIGFRSVGSRERHLDRDKRVLPLGRSSRGEGIEARVKTEAVIGLIKPA
ncbi:MAG: DNA methyltransferase [Planctomycetota bacterium]|nr:DNA methyltransferase [Planctomycetota bacterium]